MARPSHHSGLCSLELWADKTSPPLTRIPSVNQNRDTVPRKVTHQSQVQDPDGCHLALSVSLSNTMQPISSLFNTLETPGRPVPTFQIYQTTSQHCPAQRPHSSDPEPAPNHLTRGHLIELNLTGKAMPGTWDVTCRLGARGQVITELAVGPV